MKRCSIKMKVTLWYTGIVAVILGIVFSVTLVFVNKTGLSATEEEVQGAVTGFTGNIKFQDDTYYMSSDAEFYNDGVMFCVYDETGRLLYGSMPVDFPKQTTLISSQPRIVKTGQKQWMVYDSIQNYGQGKALWIRGITSIHNMETFVETAKHIIIFLFPGLIFIIGLIGYFMTKHALKSVDVICGEADRISSGDDLSQRLSLPKARDEIYHLTERFNQMFERLQESFENEKQFTADASHELRTPVAVMISECEYLLDNQDLSQEQREEVEILLRQAQKMSRLVSQMLMIAREEKTVNASQFETVDFSMLTEIVAEEMEGQAQQKCISISVHGEEQLMVQGDQTLLMRMMMNLIQNAVSYGKEKGHIWIDLRRNENRVEGQIADDGIGIQPEFLDKIWNRFYRVDKSRSSSQGTGLGLSMVKWIVRLHGGEIKVESTFGEGTVFSFWLPAL